MSAQRRFLGYLPPVDNHQIDFSHDERGPKVSPLIPLHGGRTFPMKGEGCKGLLSACRIGGAAKREEAVPADSQFLQAQGLLTSFVLKYKDPGQLYHKVEGELAVPQSGRRSFRPTANSSRPRDFSHRLCLRHKGPGHSIPSSPIRWQPHPKGFPRIPLSLSEQKITVGSSVSG